MVAIQCSLATCAEALIDIHCSCERLRDWCGGQFLWASIILTGRCLNLMLFASLFSSFFLFSFFFSLLPSSLLLCSWRAWDFQRPWPSRHTLLVTRMKNWLLTSFLVTTTLTTRNNIMFVYSISTVRSKLFSCIACARGASNVFSVWYTNSMY